ncbi:uncharacterized protein LOC120278890 [Dioscorea cayenensis subsp. rotundata]|uniref:Uncharacterized protein LOC120278890 n=1 Tax=Dioscorea cayennensis subsp. rotundata TaxID=55577 RepID=A0AB40CU36_DIOCR|nr:uncharacterized protein LOC120278890 [Dioscorea cayenensis subsp. rotundata]
MVLWEITVATAYFLGLRRTYRLALRIQRRLVGPNHPQIRQFLHRRVRGVFDVAVNVHKTVQQRDIEVGRNLGNWILRHLDRMKPTAEIRSSTCRIPTTTATTTTNNNKSSILKRVTSFPLRYQKPIFKTTETETKSRLLFTPLSIRPKSFPYLTSVMQQMRTPATNTQQFRLVSSQSTSVPISNTRMSRFGCVFRPDISQWMMLA